jgi:MFS transporter, FHS family, Na+ dependent glucose transporter 1
MTTATQSVSHQDQARWVNTGAYYLAFILLGMGGATTGPVLVDLAAQTGTQLGQLSLIFTTGSLGFLIGSSAGGRLYDRKPGHHLLALVLTFSAAMKALIPVTSQLWQLSAVFFLSGLAGGMIDVGGNTLLIWVHRDKVGPFMNGLHFAFGLGATLAPLMIVPIINATGGIAWAYWVLAILSIPVAVFLSRLPSPTGIDESEDGSGKQVDYLLVVLIAAFLFLYVGVEIGFGNWLATYAQAVRNADTATAAFLTSAFWGVFTAGRLIAIPIATVLKPRAILWINLSGAVVCLSALVLFPDTGWALWGGSMGFGLFLASTFPTMLSLAERNLPLTGRLASMFYMGISTGGMILPWLTGQFFDASGPRSGMWVILGGLLLAVVLFIAFVGHTERQTGGADA